MSKKDMIGPIPRAMVGVKTEHHGLILDIINKLGGEGANEVHKRLAIALQATTAIPTSIGGLLQQIGEPVEFSAAERFVVSDHFVLNNDKEVPISYMGQNFRGWLLGLVETAVPAMALCRRKLLRASVDAPILKTLGGEARVTTFMANVYEFLKTADKKEWYVFYITTVSGTVCTVRADWYGDGWRLAADPVSYPLPWGAGVSWCLADSVIISSF